MCYFKLANWKSIQVCEKLLSEILSKQLELQLRARLNWKFFLACCCLQEQKSFASFLRELCRQLGEWNFGRLLSLLAISSSWQLGQGEIEEEEERKDGAGGKGGGRRNTCDTKQATGRGSPKAGRQKRNMLLTPSQIVHGYQLAIHERDSIYDAKEKNLKWKEFYYLK